ncbi:MAG: AAA family ATPase [Candidatus Kariarchaeaceae archaeon]
MKSATKEQIAKKLQKVKKEIAKVVVGQDKVIEEMIIALLADGHVLLEGVPGIAKTLMVRTLAKTLSCDFKRIQFTPDLMPSDITGVQAYRPGTGEFYFKQGPIFTNMLLADEINRSPPKTQAAMLEAMQEKQISIDEESMTLTPPFIVMATQNPIEQEGTYPLPEAQVDRFLFKVIVTYPTKLEEEEIVNRFSQEQDSYQLLEEVKAVLSTKEVIQYQKTVRAEIRLSPEIIKYIVDLVSTTRESEEVIMGASPRASMWLAIAGKAHALLNGRDYVSPQDVQAVAPSILRHRIMIKPEYEFDGMTSEDIVERVLQHTSIPSLES